jgi:serine/threonine protein kinase
MQVGTRGYIAPEILGISLIGEESDSSTSNQDESSFAYTFAVDMWALGAVVFRLLTTESPFPDPRQLTRYVLYNGLFPKQRLIDRGVRLECVDFIVRAMGPVAKTRLTAAQADAHDWLSIGEPAIVNQPPQQQARKFESNVAIRKSSRDIRYDEASAEWTEEPSSTSTSALRHAPSSVIEATDMRRPSQISMESAQTTISSSSNVVEYFSSEDLHPGPGRTSSADGNRNVLHEHNLDLKQHQRQSHEQDNHLPQPGYAVHKAHGTDHEPEQYLERRRVKSEKRLSASLAGTGPSTTNVNKRRPAGSSRERSDTASYVSSTDSRRSRTGVVSRNDARDRFARTIGLEKDWPPPYEGAPQTQRRSVGNDKLQRQNSFSASSIGSGGIQSVGSMGSKQDLSAFELPWVDYGRGLPKRNKNFSDAYDNDYEEHLHRGHSGSSGAAKRVMDFFRRRGRPPSGA